MGTMMIEGSSNSMLLQEMATLCFEIHHTPFQSDLDDSPTNNTDLPDSSDNESDEENMDEDDIKLHLFHQMSHPNIFTLLVDQHPLSNTQLNTGHKRHNTPPPKA